MKLFATLTLAVLAAPALGATRIGISDVNAPIFGKPKVKRYSTINGLAKLNIL